MDQRQPEAAPTPDRSNRLLIYLLIGVAVFNALSIIGGVVYRNYSMARLAEQLEGQAVAVAQSFTTTVWPQVSGFAANAGTLDPAALRASPEVGTIGRGLTAVAGSLNLVDAEVYAKDGTVIYATQPALIGTKAADSVVLQMLAGRYQGEGRVDAHTFFQEVTPAESGAGRTLHVVTTEAEVRPNDQGVEGVLAVGQNVTQSYHRIVTIEVVAILGLVVTSWAFFPLVLLAMRPRNLR